MLRITIERDGINNLDRQVPDLRVDPEQGQRGEKLDREIRDTARREHNGFRLASARGESQDVREKVELNLENSPGVGNCGGGQSTRADVERNFPPVIHMWTQRQAQLADELRPHMQRVARRSPFRERQRWPRSFLRQVRSCWSG